PRDLLGTELGVARLALVLLDVDRGEAVVLHELLAEDDRVFVVAALPGHERDEDVLAEGQLAVVGRVGVGDDLALLHLVADPHGRTLVEAGALVGADELLEAIAPGVVAAVLDPDLRGGDRAHRAVGLGEDDLAGGLGGAVLDARADDRRLRADDRDGLALHVRAHEGAVRVVVLEERDERGRHGDDLLGRDVHVVRVRRRGLVVLVAAVNLDAVVDEVALRVEPRVRLHHRGELLLVGGEVDDLVGDLGPAVLVLLDAAERRLDEPVRVHARVRSERADEADVRSFRRLARADAAVVAVVHVADVEAGALARQAARPEGREAALVGELVERVRLLHELRELRAAEELLDRGDHRADVDELLRGRLLRLDDGHALAHDTLHAEQADAELLLDKLADRADAAVAEVVDVVGVALAVVQLDDAADDLVQVVVGQRALLHRDVEAELAVQLVAADLREVVAPEVEEQALHEVARVVRRGRVAG